MGTPGVSFRFGPGTRIVVQASSNAAAKGRSESESAGRFVADWLKADDKISLPVVVGKPGSGNQILLTTEGADHRLGEEGYSLAVTAHSIVIRARRSAGLFYGGQTLRQLVSGGAAPEVTITDRPRFPVRSFMIDSARHYQSVAYLERTIDLLAYHKLNELHWHLTDNQGWRLEIKKYPRLTSVGAYRSEGGVRYGAFYTQDQVRGLVAYAAARHIVIVPEIDIPAHSQALVASYPENACLTPALISVATPTSVPDVVCAGSEQTYGFVEDILTEVMALFPGTAIHVGGDECPTGFWHQCPRCQARIKAEGLPSERALQNYFTRRIAFFLSRHGRRLQGWDEILQGGILPKDVIVQPWSDLEATAKATRAGNDVVVSSTRYGYLDYDFNTTPLSQVYSWEPVPTGLTATQAAHILGIEANLWTERRNGDTDSDPYIWPRLIAVAEAAWTPPARRDWNDFRLRLRDAHYARLARMGLGDPTAGDGGAIYAGLIDRSDFGVKKKIGEWTPSQMSETIKTLDWDARTFVTGKGRYIVQLRYDTGVDGIDTYGATLLGAGGEVVATDTHDGFAGSDSHGQIYHLDLPAFDPKVPYVLRVKLRCDGGTDSSGSVLVTGP